MENVPMLLGTDTLCFLYICSSTRMPICVICTCTKCSYTQWLWDRHCGAGGKRSYCNNPDYGRPVQQMRTLYFHPVVSSSIFFPRLISAVADWMSTILPRMVWPQCEFRM